MYKTLSRRRLTGLDFPLFGNLDDRLDYRTHRLRAIEKRLVCRPYKKSDPWGGGGSCIGADIPQKYFSLNIGGKNEIL